ncbi:MAG: hypothetical protein HQL16_07515 [Candidatus Omnitrophica bacterium]|nr:hypothetical protein [Candidatus Omnitrophota bacterium]
MSIIDQEERISKLKKLDNPTSKELRERVQEGAKEFKTSWLKLAQALYVISRDKLYEYWGYEKFEHYVEREVGMKKAMAVKLIKTYAFVEQQEPEYIKTEYCEDREANAVPELDAISVLRLAKGKKEITKQDYQELRKQVFDKARSAALVRKDLTAIIKERKHLDPDEEREQRNAAALRRFLNALRSFKHDMDALKLVRADIVKKAEELFKELEAEVEE